MAEKKNKMGDNLWFLLGCIVQFSLGVYPTLLVYVQRPPFFLPTWSILLLGAIAAIVVVVSVVTKKSGFKQCFDIIGIFHKPLKQQLQFYTYVFSWIGGNAANIYALKYTTHPEWVQGVMLLVPFFVPILTKITDRKHKIPKVWILTVTFIVATLGSVMVIYGGHTNDQEKDKYAWLTILLSVYSTFSAAVFFVFTARMSRIFKLKPSSMLIGIKLFFIPVCTIMTFALREDWDTYRSLNVKGLIAFLGICVGTHCFARILQLTVIGKVGAPKYSIVQSLRLIANLIFNYIILGKPPNGWIVYVGAALIIVSVTFFLSMRIFLKYRELISMWDPENFFDYPLYFSTTFDEYSGNVLIKTGEKKQLNGMYKPLLSTSSDDDQGSTNIMDGKKLTFDIKVSSDDHNESEDNGNDENQIKNKNENENKNEDQNENKNKNENKNEIQSESTGEEN
ncbi:inner membrane transporter [Anaeramoeba flamelloides]|uniref:Inner membrane transporter n=1 Tax=Anaeramoeba flamelloides TaxID=1746091 RepID=A0AAV7ZVL7_9EUKA|nr:inner membrane transporter [Anaeramoeba flamelloides]